MLNLVNLDKIPKLPKREGNIDKFSMYLIQDHQHGYSVLQWKYQPHLQRNIRLYQKECKIFFDLYQQQNQAIDLVNFWQNIALNPQFKLGEWEPKNKEQLAWEHLSSYFEEKCYWAANSVCKEYDENLWLEYIFFARLIIYNPLKLKDLLIKYDSRKANLDTYIRESLEKNIKFEANLNRFSGWRLLCKKNDKELKEALQIAGYRELEISQFLFARKYFKEVYLINKINNPNRKSGHKWPDPDQEDFAKSAKCYSSEQNLSSAPHEITVNPIEINAAKMQKFMEICILALQNYPKSIVPKFSIDTLQNEGQEVNTESNTNLNIFIEESQKNLTCKIKSIFIQQLLTLKSQYKQVLLMYYGLGIKQQELAKILGNHQSSISRYLWKCNIQLLSKLIELSKPEQWTQEYIENWLKENYASPLYSDLIQVALVSAIKKLSTKDQEILQICYGQQMNQEKTANVLDLEHSTLCEILNQIRQKLQDSLMKEINNWMNNYIEEWLSEYYKSIVNSICNDHSLVIDNNLDKSVVETIVTAYLKYD